MIESPSKLDCPLIAEIAGICNYDPDLAHDPPREVFRPAIARILEHDRARLFVLHDHAMTADLNPVDPLDLRPVPRVAH